MKNFFKLFGITALFTIIGFFVVGCAMEPDNDYEMLNGAWDRGDIAVTFNDDSAVFTQINSDSGWKTVQNNGSVHIGDKKFRNIKKTDDRKWACQELTYNTSTYDIEGWADCTLVIDASGQTLQTYTPTTVGGGSTYTRKQ